MMNKNKLVAALFLMPITALAAQTQAEKNAQQEKPPVYLTNIHAQEYFKTVSHTNQLKLGLGFSVTDWKMGGLIDYYVDPGKSRDSFTQFKGGNIEMEVWKGFIPSIHPLYFMPGMVLGTGNSGSKVNYYLDVGYRLPKDWDMSTKFRFRYNQNNFQSKNYAKKYDENRNWVIGYYLTKQLGGGDYLELRPEWVYQYNNYRNANNKKSIVNFVTKYNKFITDRVYIIPELAWRGRNYSEGNKHEFGIGLLLGYKLN